MANVLEKVLRIGEGRTLRRLKAYAKAINDLEDDFTTLTDDELQDETNELRERYANGESSTTCCPRPSPPCARPPSAPWACGTSTCSSWVAPHCTSATSPR